MTEETKKCPYCGEEILAIAKKCKHCGRWLDGSNDKDDNERGDRSFLNWYFTDILFSHYADFHGRLARGRFWMCILLWYVAYGILFALDFAIFGGIPVLSTIFSLATFIPTLAMSVRRLHDVGKSGWWLFISLVPLIGSIWLIVLWASASSDDE